MEATPKISVHTGNSISPIERRLHLRQRISAIIYVEIGADNGGIVLNVSDEGMGFQAVGSLNKQNDLLLRIKLPSSRARIDVSAQIVWLSESNRQAGVRFLDANSEGLVRIREWIRSQASDGALWGEFPKQAKQVAEPQRTQETNRELRSDKRSASTFESEIPVSSQQEPPEASGDGPHERVLTAPEDPESSQNPEPVSQPVDEPAESALALRSPTEEESSQTSAFQTPSGPAKLELDCFDAQIVAPSQDESKAESTLGWPTPISWTAARAIPQAPEVPHPSVELLASAVESKTNSTPAPVNTILGVRAAASRLLGRDRVEVAIFFAVCSVLCFSIGTWVGQIVTRQHSSNVANAPVNVVPAAEQGTKESSERNSGPLASAIAQKARTSPASDRAARENREFAARANSPDVLPVRQNTPVGPADQNVAVDATIKEEKQEQQEQQEQGSPPVVPGLEKSAPLDQNGTSLSTAKEQGSNLGVAAALENSAPSAANPRIVGGLVLKPSDRFNPCYLAYRVEAAYPPEAQEQRIEGVVKIQQVVGVDGRVRSVKLLSGPPLLVPAALEAARYWRYLPALLNGQPVETEKDVEINFKLAIE